MVVCVGVSWYWPHLTQEASSSSSGKPPLYSPGTKTLPSELNTAVEGHRPALSASLKRQLLYKFFWSKLRLDSYNCFRPCCCISDTQWSSSVLLYPFIFGCHCRAFFFLETTAITYLKATILTTIFSYSVAFIQFFRFADKIRSADIWPYYIIILYWCLKNFSCSRCALSTNLISNALL